MAVFLDSPYVGGNRYKAQLHCHTTNSGDGTLTPEQLANEYRRRGYDAIAITDHGVVTVPPAIEGLVFIPASEDTATRPGAVTGADICNINIPSSHRNIPEQEMIDLTVGEGGVSTVAHPDMYGRPIDRELLVAWQKYQLMEIYNNDVGSNSEAKWDYVLSFRYPRRVWGTAVDDFHADFPARGDKGFVVLCAPEKTVPALLVSLRSGNFYASMGPDITVTDSGAIITAATDGLSTLSSSAPAARSCRRQPAY